MRGDNVAYALLRSGLFTALPEPAFEELVRDVTHVEVARGEAIVHEGDLADAAYVVLTGALEVMTRALDGDEVVLGKLGPGAHFGEQALLAGSEGRRRATVRGSAERSVVVRIGRDHLERCIGADPELHKKLRELGRRQLEEHMSRRTELVRVLLASADTQATERTFDNGEILYRQGEAPRAVYVVLAGQVELFVERDGMPLRLAVVGAGLCVGERDQDAHAATAVADGTTRVLQVRRDALAKLTASSAEMRDHLATLQSLWELPQRGFVTQHLGSIDGRPCVTQLFHLTDGRRFVSSHIIGSSAVRFEAAQGEPARTLFTPDGAVRVMVELDGRIWSIESSHREDVLAKLFARAIEGRPLLPAEERSVVESGSLTDSTEGFLCACMRVRPSGVRAAIAAGATALPALQQRTGCGLSCGACVPRLREMLGESAFFPVVIAGVSAPTDRVRRVRLASADGRALPPSRPCQHVVLRRGENGDAVERAYTLSCAAGDEWEVTIKREPNGAFSGWLFDHAKVGTPLASSAPQGSYVWDGGPAPVACFAAGIGITPALSIVRTLLREGWPHCVVVDWSTRREEDVKILGELSGPPRVANLIWKTRITSSAGRLTATDVAAWPRRLPSAVYLLCGTESFMSDVRSWLVAAGAPKERIHVESFLKGPPDAGEAS